MGKRAIQKGGGVTISSALHTPFGDLQGEFGVSVRKPPWEPGGFLSYQVMVFFPSLESENSNSGKHPVLTL